MGTLAVLWRSVRKRHKDCVPTVKLSGRQALSTARKVTKCFCKPSSMPIVCNVCGEVHLWADQALLVLTVVPYKHHAN